MLYTHNVALNIRSCRESRGYSQDYMAEMLNICQSSYANIELGKTSLSLERLMQIAGILDADIHALIENRKPENDQLSWKMSASENITHVVDKHEKMIKELKSELEFIRRIVLERK